VKLSASTLDLESLRCFVHAAAELSFRVAAKACALSPAAFGDRIRRLEEDLGAPLFERTTRKVTLTAAWGTAPAASAPLPRRGRALPCRHFQ
jgi:hypothetical protein